MKRLPVIVGVLLPLAVAVVAYGSPAAPAAPAVGPRVGDDETPAVHPSRAAVDRLLQAFNDHDVDAMLAGVTDDIGWYYVQDAAVTVEAEGKQALRKGMTGYFKAIPSARSAFEESMVSGAYVTVRERASWRQQEQDLSQSSLAVYQVRDGLVARVWYYPVER